MTTAQRIEAALAGGLLGLPAAALRLLAGPPVVVDGLTLDVQCQLLLRLQRLRGADTVGSGDVASERRKLDAQSRVLEPRAAGSISTRDLRIAGAEGDIGARVYYPAGHGASCPALVFYHGGGFVLGSLDSHDGVCRVLAERAHCAVISVDYRLAPEHPAPAPTHDAIAAFRDIARRADGLGLDPALIAIGGDSAGGNLAAVVAQQTRADTLAPCFELLFYPAIDYARAHDSVAAFGTGFLLDKAAMDWFRAQYLPAHMDAADPRISPIYGELSGLAPALVITAGFDPLRDEGEAYAEALRAAGVAVEKRRYPGLIHGFVNFAGGLTRGDAAISDAANALKTAFAAPD